MQNDFISREATIAAITKRAGCFKKGPAKSAMEDAQIIIESVPAADVVPVVHGQILTVGNGLTHNAACSACGGDVDPWDYGCRHCCAKFDENDGAVYSVQNAENDK